MRSDVGPYLVCELHLAQPPPEPGLPGGAPVQTPPVIYADHSVSLASEQMRPVIDWPLREIQGCDWSTQGIPELPQPLEAVGD